MSLPPPQDLDMPRTAMAHHFILNTFEHGDISFLSLQVVLTNAFLQTCSLGDIFLCENPRLLVLELGSLNDLMDSTRWEIVDLQDKNSCGISATSRRSNLSCLRLMKQFKTSSTDIGYVYQDRPGMMRRPLLKTSLPHRGNTPISGRLGQAEL